MVNKRVRGSTNEGADGGSNSNDFISQLPDDVLLMILCLLPIKDVVVTSGLSTRWRFLWCNLTQLNFEATEALHEMTKNPKLCDLARSIYISQVHGVIQSYNHPKVQEVRIRFDLDYDRRLDVDKWLQFAVKKNVEILELDLGNGDKFREYEECYDFPLRLSDRNIGHLFKWPTSNATRVEIPCLKKLVLKSVNLRGATVLEILTNSPNLETLSIHGSGYLRYLSFCGQAFKLKRFEIAYCTRLTSLHLYDLNLESFAYNGPAMDLRLVNLPKLKEIEIGEGVTWLENKMFSLMPSCLSNLEILSLNLNRLDESFSIPELPNVKTLKVTTGARKDVCLLDIVPIAQACLSLETLTIELLWFRPSRRRRKVKEVANHPHQHLKLLKIMGYYARVSDLEVVVYFINNSIGLKRILIDPCCQGRPQSARKKDMLKTEEAARSLAKRQLESLKPRGVELVIL